MDLPCIRDLPDELLEAADEIRAEAEAACGHVVNLLGSGATSLGPEIDWHQDFKSGYRWPHVFYQDVEATRLDDDSDAKVPWELSRGHQLVALARASVLFEDDRYAAELETQFHSWLAENPTGVGINWQNAMETALRAVSWVWAIGTVECWRPLNSVLRQRLAQSLASHARHIEHNLEGNPWVRSNHYMADLLGLLVLGWALPSDPRAKRWWRTAKRGFEREIVRQTYGDGVDFEASIAYHGLVLEILLLAAWTARRAGEPFSAQFDGRLAAMVVASRALRHPNGRAPQFGDSDSGRVLPATSARPATADHVIWLGAAVLGGGRPLPGKPSPEVAWTLGLGAWQEVAVAPLDPPPTRRQFDKAGYCVLGDQDIRVVLRAGDVGQNGNGGHAHNDALSFELSFAGHPLIVDSGTYLYTADPSARNAFRGTDAHNTVRVDGQEINPIDPNQLFQLRQVASTRFELAGESLVVVSHDGYRRLPRGSVIHRRSFALLDAVGIEITDDLHGVGNHLFEWFLHLAPGTEVEPANGGGFRLVREGTGLDLTWLTSDPLEVAVEPGWVSDSFGVRERAPMIVARAEHRAPLTVRWSMVAAARRPLPQTMGLAT